MLKMGQQGFTLLEVLVTVTILGILASVAVPRFANAAIMANTAKIVSDLQTLDTAIAVYEMENGFSPSSIDKLSEYVNDINNLKPPKGSCMLKTGDTLTIESTTVYTVSSEKNDVTNPNGRCKAFCANHPASDFGRKE